MTSERWMPNEILTVSSVWKAPDGSLWYVTFSLADVNGRLECVGMSLRSYVRRIVLGDDGLQHELHAEEPMGYFELTEELDVAGVHGPARHDVMDQIGPRRFGEKAFLTPSSLKAVVLRAFPFFSVLSHARRDEAETQRSSLAFSKALDEAGLGTPSPDVDRTYEYRAEAMEGRRHKLGRPPKYTAAQFHRLAAVYRKARDIDGSPSPIKDTYETLGEEFGLTRSATEKLIARCKRSGLIPRTGPSRESGQDSSTDRKEQP